jgi:hypothetical protein
MVVHMIPAIAKYAAEMQAAAVRPEKPHLAYSKCLAAIQAATLASPEKQRSPLAKLVDSMNAELLSPPKRPDVFAKYFAATQATQMIEASQRSCFYSPLIERMCTVYSQPYQSKLAKYVTQSPAMAYADRMRTVPIPERQQTTPEHKSQAVVEIPQPKQVPRTTTTDGSNPRHLNIKQPKINVRMIAILQTQPEAECWTIRQWATHLGCAISTVFDTPTWKKLESCRFNEKATHKQDRRRRPKRSDSVREGD